MAHQRTLPALLAFAALLPAPCTWAQAQTAVPQPTPTLKSVLLAELHSTHDKEEWFVPVGIAVAGLTADQARWIPPAGGANNPAPADHSAGMIAYHLLF